MTSCCLNFVTMFTFNLQCIFKKRILDTFVITLIQCNSILKYVNKIYEAESRRSYRVIEK